MPRGILYHEPLKKGINMLHLLNTAIIPASDSEITVHVSPIPADEVMDEIAGETLVSHVGHQSTADIMSAHLGVPVPLDRTPLVLPESGQTNCLIYQLNQRGEEGRIYTTEEMKAMPCSWRFMIILTHVPNENAPHNPFTE